VRGIQQFAPEAVSARGVRHPCVDGGVALVDSAFIVDAGIGGEAARGQSRHGVRRFVQVECDSGRQVVGCHGRCLVSGGAHIVWIALQADKNARKSG
jgi:hypothetical protein